MAGTAGAVNGLEVRSRWLGHPAFLGCAALLILNDQVLKYSFPGWWTGKLSDFAGLAVVAVVAAVTTGPRLGIFLAGVAFCALKLVPGVAETVAPLLGGITRRDAGDLLALSVLVPLGYLLGATRPVGRPGRQMVTTRQHRWAEVRVVASVVLPVIGASLAVGATAATSCAPDPAVTSVTARGSTFFAHIDVGAGRPRQASSSDGGQTWHGSFPIPEQRTSTATNLYRDPGMTGPQRACDADGTCWALRDRRAIERTSPGEPPVEEIRFDDAEFSEISAGCGGGSIGVLSSIASTRIDGETHVVASLGAAGVLVRSADGTWQKRGVPASPAGRSPTTQTIIAMSPPITGLGIIVAVWALGRRRWASTGLGVIVATVSWLLAIAIIAWSTSMIGSEADRNRLLAPFAVVWTAVTAFTAIAVARRPRPLRPVGHDR